MDTIISASGDKKAGKAAKAAFLKRVMMHTAVLVSIFACEEDLIIVLGNAQVDELDYAMRSKNKDKALAALATTEAALGVFA